MGSSKIAEHNLSPELLELIRNGGAQADWNENDSGASSYVKNRTHYEEAVKIAIFPETVLDFTDSEYVNVELSSALVADKEYVVVWDNAIRNVTPYEQSDGTVVLGYDGNTADEFFRVFYNTDSTVEVYSVAMSTSKTHTIEIYTAENIIHKLDHKYLYTPDWNQNDEDAADYVKGRTHYEEETLSQIYTVSIEAGNSNVSNDSDGINYINVDATRWVFDGVVYENVEYTNIQNDDFYLNVYSTDDFSLAFKTSFDNSSQIYIFDVFDTSASHTLEVYKIENIVHPLDEKYLPETVAKKDYVDEQIHLITSTGVSVLKTYDEIAVAETDGQTEFPIKLDGFDKATDTVFVVSGRTILAPVEDYNIVGANIVLNEGVPLGRTINIRVQKNVPIGEEGGVSGRVIMDGTLPLSKLEEKVSVQQGGLYINSETTEEDKAEAQEALKEIGGFLPLDGSVQMGEGLIAQIQSLIDSGVIEVGGFKSPIKILTGFINGSSGKSISGTGKGLLQVYKLSNYGSLTINIDGVSASAFNPSDDGGWMQLEFAKSYSVSLDDGSAAYLAMFY